MKSQTPMVLGLAALLFAAIALFSLLVLHQVNDFVDQQSTLDQAEMGRLVDFLGMLGWEILGFVLALVSGLLLVLRSTLLRLSRQKGTAADSASAATEAILDIKAHTDPLTELPNKLALSLLLEQSRQRAHTSREGSFSVCLFDVDGLTEVNHKYGREFGDRLLKSVAQRVRAIARQGDYLARLGDDQFVLVVHGLANIWEMEPVLSRLMHVTAAPVTLGQTQLRFAFSVGVTLYPSDASSVEGLMAHALEAMSRAKRAGGGRWQAWQADQAEAVQKAAGAD